jgi:hypothetical protein
VTPEVSDAVQQLKSGFPSATVTAIEVGDGGAHVIIESVDPGEIYNHRQTWLGFTIGFQYPYADIYPLFVRPDLARADGAAIGEGISTGHSFEGRPAIQLSRRSNKLNPAIDTALLKVTKVLAWLCNR